MGGRRKSEHDALHAVFVQLRETLAPLGIHVDPALFTLWVDLQRHGAEPFAAGGKFGPDVASRLTEVAGAIRLRSTDGPDSEQLGG